MDCKDFFPSEVVGSSVRFSKIGGSAFRFGLLRLETLSNKYPACMLFPFVSSLVSSFS